MSETVKFSMTLGRELNDYCLAEAKRIGITKNAYIAMCVDNVKRQSDSMVMTREANALFDKIKIEEEK